MTEHLDLNGTWELWWYDGERGRTAKNLERGELDRSRPVEAQVPGEVHLDLMRAGLIEEPAVGMNALRARWVEESIWLYRRTFDAPKLRKGERAWLVFERLDLAAVVSLNRAEVARHANVFHPLKVEVTDRLKAGRNELLVEIESGLFSVADKPYEGYGVHPAGKLHKRQWLRTTQSTFSWDWSLRLVNVGLTGGVRLERWRGARVDGASATAALSDDLKTGTVRSRIFIEGLADKPLDGVLRVEAKGAGAASETRVRIKPGMQTLEASLVVQQPDLWWPVGHGNQPLYDVRTTLTVDGAAVYDVTRRVGFRRVRIDQRPHPRSGSYFIVEVNGKPVFCKGGNFVPADPILMRTDRDRYAALVDRALDANFNLLRVWGGGLYESDDFYDLCDARGVLVWQEFIFACAKYPIHDEAFLADVRREAVHQVRRLAHHASLAVWCGNNEMELAAYEWGYDRGVALPDYALFHMVLPRIVSDEDGTRYYHPSSPWSPGHDAPNRDDRGDQHPWSIGFGNTDFRGYRNMICRFPNEGGTLGPTALPTVLACLAPGQERIGSFAWELHENSIAGRGSADDMLDQWLGLPIRGMGLEDYVYWAGLLQGMGLQEYIRNFRRRMFDSASAIFWMYNDAWPVVRSWTIVDYYLRRTPSFHPVRRAFAPLTVALAAEGDKVKVFGVNEGRAAAVRVRYGLCALAGGMPLDRTREARLPANRSVLLAEFDRAEWTKRGENAHVAFAVLSGAGGRELARETLFLPFYKEMRWPRAEVSVTRERGKAVFRSETFAWRVCLDLDGERALPDNFFDLLPGVPYELPWPEELGEPKVVRVGNLV